MLGGSEHPESVWISYGFIHFSYVMLIITPWLVRKGNRASDYRRPLFGISFVYFLVQFVVGIVFIYLASETYKTALSVQLVLMGIYFLLMLSNMLANEHTADSVLKREEELKYIKNASALLDAIMRQISDTKLRKKVEKVYDLIHGSPTQSSSCVFEIENEVLNEIDNLQNAVNRNDTERISQIAEKIQRLAENRNRQLRVNYN